MEHLRDGIGLRGYGQKDPKQEYKKEGYTIFLTMMAEISSNVATNLFKAQVRREADVEQMQHEEAERHEAQLRAAQARHGSELDPGADQEEAPQQRAAMRRPQQQARIVQPVQRATPKIGRNDPCPCGSGQKFKKCHGAALEEEGAADQDDANA